MQLKHISSVKKEDKNKTFWEKYKQEEAREQQVNWM